MAKDKNFVLYKDIKAKITMEMLLKHYGLFDKLRPTGNNLTGCCPIHGGSNPRQFSVSLARNVFNCFGDCKAGGNVLDFVAKMEGVSIHKAGVLLKEWFLNDFSEGKRGNISSEPKKLVRKENKGVRAGIEDNKPLEFQLKSLQADHAFFKERGIDPATVQAFGLGYCLKGMLKGFIAIPIHNEKSELVAYCGRAVTPEQIEIEKYKQPPNFKKSLVVYNFNRQDPFEKVFILVESFISVWWLHQAGLKNVVALMGSSLSDRQEELIVKALGPSGQVILLFDGDEDGQKCTADCLARLGKQVFVKALDISPYARKPHQLTPDQIKELIH